MPLTERIVLLSTRDLFEGASVYVVEASQIDLRPSEWPGALSVQEGALRRTWWRQRPVLNGGDVVAYEYRASDGRKPIHLLND